MPESVVHGYFPVRSQLNRHRSQHTDTYSFVSGVGSKITYLMLQVAVNFSSSSLHKYDCLKILLKDKKNEMCCFITEKFVYCSSVFARTPVYLYAGS